MSPLSFRPVTHADLPHLARWMNEPHWRQWWGEQDAELGFVIDMVEGRDTSRPFLFLLEGEPIGYIQYWLVGHHQTPEWIADCPGLAGLPPETVGVDLSISEPHLLSQGIGTAALRQFIEMLRGRGHETIIIDPDPENHRAVRAYEKAGFRPIPHLAGRNDDTLIMQFDPSAEPTGSAPRP